MINVYRYGGEFGLEGWRGKWNLVGKEILPFMVNPKYQGEYHLYFGDVPIEKITERDIMKIKGRTHTASNFGETELGLVKGTTTIQKRGTSDGYILAHAPNKQIVKFTENAKYYTDLTPNYLKLCDGGDFYLVEGTFDDLLNEISSNGYIFIEREENESWVSFELRFKDLLRLM